MSSSQLTIFCIILIALFPLHEFVNGQGGKAGKFYCQALNCDANDKNRSCFICKRPKTSHRFNSMAECNAACHA
ncbi:unnamed protein product [Eruca vesicaria subsp. sativa]|uniref:Uncharacterized protein n=1 Tax=Eruca vesicaria subsp. sativa TaxID=29727 RepID=A0ABC8JR84_ERUVS|nr:unnamed protein product [Eruca vesicaria subsp. sativa]